MTHHRPDPSDAAIAFATAEVLPQRALENAIEARAKFIESVRAWAIAGADLALLGEFCRETRDSMAIIWKVAKEGLLEA